MAEVAEFEKSSAFMDDAEFELEILEEVTNTPVTFTPHADGYMVLKGDTAAQSALLSPDFVKPIISSKYMEGVVRGKFEVMQEVAGNGFSLGLANNSTSSTATKDRFNYYSPTNTLKYYDEGSEIFSVGCGSFSLSSKNAYEFILIVSEYSTAKAVRGLFLVNGTVQAEMPRHKYTSAYSWGDHSYLHCRLHSNDPECELRVYNAALARR